MRLGEDLISTNYNAMYRLDSVNDSGLNGYNLTNGNSVTFSAGRYGNAANFGTSGTNKYLERTSSILSSASENFLFTFWFKLLNTSSSNTDAHFCHLRTASQHNSRCRYNISGGNITIDVTARNTSVVASVTFAVDTEWHFVIGKISADGNVVEIYVDFDKYKSTTTGSGTAPGAVNQFVIGNDIIHNKQAWALIEDFMVYTGGIGFSNFYIRSRQTTHKLGHRAIM